MEAPLRQGAGMVLNRGRKSIEAVFSGQSAGKTPVYGVITSDELIEKVSGKTLTRKNSEAITAHVYRACIDFTRRVRDILGPDLEEKLAVDDFGYSRKKGRWTEWVVEKPYDTIEGMKGFLLQEIEFFRSWKPEVNGAEEKTMSLSSINSVERIQKLLGDDTLITGRVPIGTAPGCYFRDGLMNFSYLLADFPEVDSEWIKARHEMNLKKIEAMANVENSPVEFIDADVGCKHGLLISPEYMQKTGWFRILTELVDCFHAHGTKVVFHSDGDSRKILKDLVDTGIDGINPIETAAGMSIQLLHREFPDLILVGGLDNHILRAGSTDEVREVTNIARRVAALLLLEPRLDANYRRVVESAYPWLHVPEHAASGP